MKAKLKLDRFQSMEATMEITMTVQEWSQLKKTISSDYPGWKFAGLISDLISDADKHFETEKEYEA